ncbi:AraC family transcriptional regulator [Microbacterium saperdae]|uniref:AraC family transcriptional regulator n=1 Tax=Microbacterium saperdae TaxID=69368 RepID=UPI0011528815|nr:AraC family transcriptional regulator [Microbacterium saperdae]GGM49630.1 hypothetical protein GCM10010489_21310 [Microbacterium saperdae]
MAVDAVKVVFTVSGWARVHASAGEVLLTPGSVLTIPKNLECRGLPMGHVRTVTLYIDSEYLSDQVRWLSTAHPLVHHLHSALNGDPTLRTLQLATSAMHQLTPSLVSLAQSANDARIDFAMLSFVARVFDAVGRLSGVSAGSLDFARVVPRREVLYATTLLRAELSRPWRIEDLAREVAVSPSHLARLFRTQLGISPAAFLRQVRADRMAELLTTTSLSVSEAGAVVGWTDAAVASRSFKQRYGVPPSVYASSCREKTITPAPVPQPAL